MSFSSSMGEACPSSGTRVEDGSIHASIASTVFNEIAYDKVSSSNNTQVESIMDEESLPAIQRTYNKGNCILRQDILSPANYYCCLKFSKDVLKDGQLKEIVKQYATFKGGRLKDITKQFYKQHRQRIIPFIFGMLFGITFTALLFQQQLIYTNSLPWQLDGAKQLLEQGFKTKSPHPGLKAGAGVKAGQPISVRALQKDIKSSKSSLSSFGAEDETVLKTRIFVGVITAEKFLSTRSLAVNNTWGSQVDKIEFFTQHGSSSKYGIPVVNLAHASDTEYPPQRKAFEMLKHMCEHHLDDFEWFMRADDDVYVRVELLKKYLAQIDSKLKIYMGQPGHGVPEVRQQLGLKGHNFCMGGPGVLFNRKALKGLCPHIDDCIRDVVSKEEDVEIGRCVTKHLHIECTHAWEDGKRKPDKKKPHPQAKARFIEADYKKGIYMTLKLFYHSYQEEYTEEKPFLGNLAENEHVRQALTLHHLKVPYIMYRVHRHYSSLLLHATAQELDSLQREQERAGSSVEEQRHLADDKHPVTPFASRRLREVNTWLSFGTESMHHASPAYVTRDITNDVLADLKQVGETGIDEAIDHPQVQKFTYSHVSDGYLRSDASRGTDYLLDVYFNSRQPSVADEIRRVHLLRPVGGLEVSGVRLSPPNGGDFHFYVIIVVHLHQATELQTFMRNYYEPSFLARGRSARLIVVPVDSKGGLLESASLTPTVEEVVNWYRVKHQAAMLEVLPLSPAHHDPLPPSEPFARGVAFVRRHLQGASAARLASTVLLLTTTNVTLTADVMGECASRTGEGANGFNSDNSYNFIEYKSRKKKWGPPHLYQPVPFRLHPAAAVGPFPTALVPQARGLKPGLGKIPNSMINSDHGFWDSSVALTEVGNAVTAPLCGRLSDLYEPVSAAMLPSSADKSLTFREALYERVYAGRLTVVRAPDRSFVNVPKR